MKIADEITLVPEPEAASLTSVTPCMLGIVLGALNCLKSSKYLLKVSITNSFTDKEKGSEKLSDLAKVTKLGKCLNKNLYPGRFDSQAFAPWHLNCFLLFFCFH